MTLEGTMRTNVVDILRCSGLDARPVENLCEAGYPDVEFVGGTCELKAIREWPKRDGTPLRIDHYTTQQRLWHKRRWAKGGNVTVLLQVGREFLLFDGPTAAEYIGEHPQIVLRHKALAFFPTLSSLRDGLAKAITEARSNGKG